MIQSLSKFFEGYLLKGTWIRQPARVCRRFAIWLPFALLYCLPGYSQIDPYRFSRLDINQGLSHNMVNCIFRDGKGFLWLGTMSGLDRYDGYNFKVFKHDLRDTASLSDDYIEKILEGPYGKLWVFTRNGINFYDPMTGKFERNPRSFVDGLVFTNLNIRGSILDMRKDSAGNFWFLSLSDGIYQYDPGRRKTIRYVHRSEDPGSLYSNDIASMEPTGRGDWWILYRDGVMEKMNSRTGRILFRSGALKEAAPGESLNWTAYCDPQNDLWLYAAASSKGVYFYREATNSVVHIDKSSQGKGLNSGIVNGIIQDEKERIWIATDHGGIDLINKKDFSVQYIMSREEDGNSLSQNSINTIYRDREGIIWIGTYKKGVCYHQEDIMKFPLVREIIPNARNPNYNDINRFVEDPKGNLWIGTNGGGLVYFNRQTGRFSQYLHDPSNPASLTNDVIVSMTLDHEQKLWIGTYYGGLDCFDGKTFHHYRHSDKDSGSLSDDRVWEVHEDADRQLWVGTFSQGLDRLDRAKGGFIHYRPFAANSVKSGYITGLTDDSKGNMWIATAYGLDVLDRSTGLFRHYGHDDANPATSLSNNNTFSTFEDSRGLIWVSTREGLDLVDPTTGKFRTFRTEDGLPDNTVMDIQEDNEHHLWLSTPNGLSNVSVSMDSATGKVFCQFRNYDESDGLQGREFNENASLKTRRGELLFGGSNGFNLFDPSRILSKGEQKTLILTDFRVFNRSLEIGEKLNGHVILTQSMPETKEITLLYNENVFSLEFAALDFSNPEKVRYSYRLDGFNRQWLMADSKTRMATFTNLDPGDYTFRVRAANDLGGWDPEGLALHIKILPPFWKTPLAYVIYGLVLLGVLILARRMTLQRARMRFAIEQERKEAHRLHELDMMKIRFYTNVSHEFRTPLSLILTPLDKIIRDTENPARKSQFQLIHRNARRLLNLVNQLLDFRTMEEQELRLNLSKGDIIKFVKELSFSFADMAEKKNIDFSFHASIRSLQTRFDQDKLERIVFNLLSNAFKFTPEKGRITVELNLLPTSDPTEYGLVQIAVKDTGIGVEKDKQEKIFERFFQDDIPGSMLNQGNGIGLAITREFVRLHNGSIYVDSEPGKGSTFTVLLPAEKIDPHSAMPPSSWGEDVRITNETATENGAFSFIGPNGQPADPADPQPAAPDVSGDAAANGGKKPTVLLVEDNEDFRYYLKDNLREFFTIVEATNGHEGWQRTLGTHPDLVVSDISMPEMNGIDLCRKIKSDKRTSFVPVILLTALIGEEQQLRGLETGANDYMTKPFNFSILLSKIRNLLAQQETARKTWQKQVEANTTKVRVDSPDESFIQQVLLLIEKNISNPDFSVEEMSRELFLSRVALYKKILTLTGKTPIELIRSLRLKKAAQLLEKSRFTVAEIAYEVGFNNPKYFSRYFKAEYGMIPSAYQAKRRAEIQDPTPL